MYRLIAVSLLTMVLAALPVAGAAESPAVSADSVAKGSPLVLSREQCVAIALSDNPTIRVADMEVKRMDYSKRETIASLLPTIDFSAAYQRSIELQTVKMNMGGESQSFKMGSDNTWTMGFSASLPLVAPQFGRALTSLTHRFLKVWKTPVHPASIWSIR